MKIKGLLFIVLSIFLIFPAAAQQFMPNYSLQGHYGTIIPHNQILEPFGANKPAGINLSYSRLYTSENAWQLCDCFYRTGTSLSWYHFDNQRELGQTVNFRVFFEPLIAPENDFYASLRLGTGVAYISKVYDPETNPRNYFYSLPVSFPLYGAVFLHYKLVPDWELKLGGYFNHISNGGIKQPNKGMNFPALSAGLVYNPVAHYPSDYTPKQVHVPGNVRWDVRVGTNIKVKNATREYSQKACWVTAFYASGTQYLTRRMGITGGAEFIIDGYQRETVRRKGIDNNPNRLGMLLGFTLELGKFSFAPKLGLYALLPNHLYDHLYQRYDLTYRLTPNLHAGVYMNAVLNTADFMGFTLGLEFRKEK